jgi:hypothetical protein
MYVEDAVQHLQPSKSGGTAAVAALSLEDTPPPPTLWVIVELERPVFCPENSICVASKLEVNPAAFVPARSSHVLLGRACSWVSHCVSRACQQSDSRPRTARTAQNSQNKDETRRCEACD